MVQSAARLKAVQMVHMGAHIYAFSIIQGHAEGVVQSLGARRKHVRVVKALHNVV